MTYITDFSFFLIKQEDISVVNTIHQKLNNKDYDDGFIIQKIDFRI